MKVKETKPSNLKRDEEVQFWERQLKLSEEKLKEKAGDMKAKGSTTQGWKSLIAFYKGDQWRGGQGGKKGSFDRITANQAKSNIDSIRPQLYFQNPRIKISLKNPSIAKQDIPEIDPMTGQPMMQPGPPNPMTGQPTPIPVIRIPKGTPIANIGGQVVNAQEQCELIEAIDNYTFTETRAKTKIKRIINDALILNYGCAKWEWVVETEEDEETDAQGKPTGKQIEKVSRQYAQLSRIKPWCIVWDSELDEFDIESANWIAEIKYLSEDDIKNDKSLSGTGTDDLPEPSYYLDSDYGIGDAENPEECARYKVYEIHDLKHGELLIWIEGSDKINRKESPSPYKNVEGSIYTVLGFDDVPDESIPISIIDQIKSKAEAYNKTLSYMVNHVGRFNRKYKQLKGNMDEAELEKWERGEDGVTVMVKDMGSGPDPITDAAINPDVYNVAGLLKREITEDVGVSAYNRSGREPGVDTAFEANLIQGGADIKIQEKRDTVREFCIRLIKKLNQILRDNADTPTIVKIAGEKGEQWIEWTNADIQGEFIEDVDIYSSMPFSEEVEKKQAMEMLSLTAADPFFNPFKVRRQIVRVFKWPEDLLYSEQEYAAMQQQQMQQQAAMQQSQENQRQQSQNIRPTKGPPGSTVRNGPDQKAAIAGQARNRQ